ncbi:MAG: 3-hydroxyacyl-CoA dehydrogenase [Rhodobacteraceae bacterium]|nr:3-hydroxyacyl-CoA dehydrogenase [Paracoccaceae bacterium]
MMQAAIIGAGLIGHSWAVVVARAGHRAVLHDADAGALSTAPGRIARALADLDGNGLLDEPADAVAARIAITPDLEEAIAGAAVVHECVPEDLSVKRQMFARLDAAAAPGTILASATSTIPASAFTEGLAGRERCIIVHPSTPPHILPLVEICPAPWTSAATTDRTVDFVSRLGQVPSLVRREVDGFILNRLQAAVVCEAFRLWEDGYASAADIEATVRETLGMRWALMGPFETISLNAPNGLVDYLSRFGDLFYRINSTQQARPFDMQAVRRLEEERLASGLDADVEARRALRDRRLLALAAHKRHGSP